MKKPIKTKAKLPTTWDLSPLYKNDTDPKIEQDLKEAQVKWQAFIRKWKNTDQYLKDPKVLRKALDEYEKLEGQVGLTKGYGYYLSMRLAQDENNPKLKAAATKMKDLAVALANEIEFFTIRIAKIPPAEQKKFLQSKELAPYHKFIKGLFEDAKHILSEEEEKIMNLKSAPSHDYWVRMTSNLVAKETRLVLDEDGKTKNRPYAEIASLTSSQKKKVRDSAAKAINDIYRANVDTAEHEINSILDDKKINDGLRKFSRPDQARHLSDDIESEVVDAMISAVTKSYKISQDFYKLKAKLLGLPKLAYHERNVPFGSADKKITYPEAVSLVGKVLNNLDPEFGEIFTGFVENGQVDVYPKPGRGHGAFCAYDLPIYPTYIFLNHTNKLRDALTLAHEVGHGINDELIKKSQHSLYFSTPLSTAEVASTFMEDFVLEEIGKQADDEMRLALQMEKLGDDVSSIFRQVACYRFEQDLHNEFRKVGYLTKEDIGRIFQKNMKAYMGPAVKQSPGSENFWVAWSHIRSFFYVYSYASGLLISKAMQSKVKTNPKFIAQIKDFLSVGTSDSPKNAFKKMGINISQPAFWQQGLKEIEELLKDTEKLAKKLKKI